MPSKKFVDSTYAEKKVVENLYLRGYLAVVLETMAGGGYWIEATLNGVHYGAMSFGKFALMDCERTMINYSVDAHDALPWEYPQNRDVPHSIENEENSDAIPF